MKIAALALALILASCVSSKDKIADAITASDDRAAAIVAEATASAAEISAVSALDLPEEAQPTLKSAGDRQRVIIGHAADIRSHNSDARDGLKGVIDRPKPLWLKAVFGLFALGLAGIALLHFAPGLLVKVLPSAAGLLGRSRRASADLLARGKTVEAIAAMRASDPRFDAAWREAKR